MTSWIVSPPEKTDWRLDRAELVTRLSRDWPTAQIIDREEPRLQTEDLVWLIQTADGDLEGSLDVDGNGMYLDGPVGIVTNLAAWLRTVVPASVELVLYDDMYSQVCRLLPGMTAADIERDMAAT